MKRNRYIASFTVLTLLACVFLVSAAFAQQETKEGQEAVTGTVEIGVRQVVGDVYGRPDLAFKPLLGTSRYNEYRATPNGFFVQKFNFYAENLFGTNNYAEVRGRDGLERDQAYLATVGQYGKYKLQFRYDQTPHIFTNTARTWFNNPAPGVYTLPTLVRNTLLATPSAGIPAAMNTFLGDARFVDMSLRRNMATGSLAITPTDNLTFGFQYSRETQNGLRPIGVHFFASPSTISTEVPEAINYNTQEIKAGAEYAKKSWGVQFNYLGSLFQNNVGQLLVDNPFYATNVVSDYTTYAQMDLYPDNNAHSFNFSGATDLGKYVRVMASITPGFMHQNDKFVPGTTNPLIVGMNPLPATSLDGKKQTLAMNYTATSRPYKNLELTARYRQYDYNNDTPMRFFSTVQADSATADHGPVVHENEAYGYNRKTIEFTGTYLFAKKNLAKIGYEWEGMDREHRDVAHSTENSVFALVDLNPAKMVNFRLSYRHSNRDPEQYVATEEAQLAAARRFDESARLRDRVEASVEITPMDKFSFGATYGTTQDNYDRPDATNPVVYGLLKDIGYNYGVDFTYAPVAEFSMFGEYSRERYKTRMRSRQRSFPVTPANDLANNDWASSSNDRIDTYTTGFDVYLAKRKMTLTSYYSLSDARGSILNRALGDRTLPGFVVTSIMDFPNTTSRLHQVVTAMKFRLTERISPKFEYRFDRYDRVDFQTDKMNLYMFPIDSGSRQMSYLGADTPSYKGHYVAATLEYRF